MMLPLMTNSLRGRGYINADMVLIALMMVLMFQLHRNPATHDMRRIFSLSTFSRILASTASDFGIPRKVICKGINMNNSPF